MVDLGTLGGGRSRALALNDAGQIVGYALKADTTPRTVLWAPSTVKPVIGPPATVPAKPLAGRRFSVAFKITRSDTGAPLTSGTMTSDASIESRSRAGRNRRPGSPRSASASEVRFLPGASRPSTRAFGLASRGLILPDGTRDDPPGWGTVYALAGRKAEILLRRLREGDVRAFEGARLYLALARDAGIRCGVVSGSTNTRSLLNSARIGGLIDDLVDGNTMDAEGKRAAVVGLRR
jgi:hypothetical protein